MLYLQMFAMRPSVLERCNGAYMACSEHTPGSKFIDGKICEDLIPLMVKGKCMIAIFVILHNFQIILYSFGGLLSLPAIFVTT